MANASCRFKAHDVWNPVQVISSIVKLDHEDYLTTYFQSLAKKNSVAAQLKSTLEKSGKVLQVDWDARGRTKKHIATSSLVIETFAADTLDIEFELNGQVVDAFGICFF